MAASRDTSSELVNAYSLSFMLLEIDCPLTTNRLGAALSFNDSAHKEHRGQGTILNGCFQNCKIILHLSWHLPVKVKNGHCMKKRIFALRKFVKRTENIIFSLVVLCSCFTEISYFPNFPSNENVRKQHLSASAYSCVDMKFSHTIAGRKD